MIYFLEKRQLLRGSYEKSKKFVHISFRCFLFWSEKGSRMTCYRRSGQLSLYLLIRRVVCLCQMKALMFKSKRAFFWALTL